MFAWAQTRLNLPGWYGLGSGLAAAAWSGVAAGDSDEGLPIEGLTALRRAYSAWPLLATLLDNAEMSLAKTDRAIAARYLALGGRQDLADRVLAEYDLTRRLVLAVTGHDRLLADRRVLSRAIVLRDPYVDALSYLQLRALSALRADQAPEERRLRRAPAPPHGQRHRRRPPEHRLSHLPPRPPQRRRRPVAPPARAASRPSACSAARRRPRRQPPRRQRRPRPTPSMAVDGPSTAIEGGRWPIDHLGALAPTTQTWSMSHRPPKSVDDVTSTTFAPWAGSRWNVDDVASTTFVGEARGRSQAVRAGTLRSG